MRKANQNVIFWLLATLFLPVSLFAQTVKTKDYYQLKDGNSWNYAAPPTWKGDYVSEMKAGDLAELNGEKILTVKHFDATKAAKVLAFVKCEGLYYLREEFAGGDGYAEFDTPVLWFPEKIKIGETTKIETAFTRHFKDRKTAKGIFKLTQKYSALEDLKVTAGDFKKALRIESETFWDLADGRLAKTQNVYHYAKNVGVIKASARFIIIKNGKEIINRLVETELKSYRIR